MKQRNLSETISLKTPKSISALGFHEGKRYLSKINKGADWSSRLSSSIDKSSHCKFYGNYNDTVPYLDHMKFEEESQWSKSTDNLFYIEFTIHFTIENTYSHLWKGIANLILSKDDLQLK